jgi:hypothetical protein
MMTYFFFILLAIPDFYTLMFKKTVTQGEPGDGRWECIPGCKFLEI